MAAKFMGCLWSSCQKTTASADEEAIPTKPEQLSAETTDNKLDTKDLKTDDQIISSCNTDNQNESKDEVDQDNNVIKAGEEENKDSANAQLNQEVVEKFADSLAASTVDEAVKQSTMQECEVSTDANGNELSKIGEDIDTCQSTIDDASTSPSNNLESGEVSDHVKPPEDVLPDVSKDEQTSEEQCAADTETSTIEPVKDKPSDQIENQEESVQIPLEPSDKDQSETNEEKDGVESEPGPSVSELIKRFSSFQTTPNPPEFKGSIRRKDKDTQIEPETNGLDKSPNTDTVVTDQNPTDEKVDKTSANQEKDTPNEPIAAVAAQTTQAEPYTNGDKDCNQANTVTSSDKDVTETDPKMFTDEVSSNSSNNSNSFISQTMGLSNRDIYVEGKDHYGIEITETYVSCENDTELATFVVVDMQDEIPEIHIDIPEENKKECIEDVIIPTKIDVLESVNDNHEMLIQPEYQTQPIENEFVVVSVSEELTAEPPTNKLDGLDNDNIGISDEGYQEADTHQDFVIFNPIDPINEDTFTDLYAMIEKGDWRIASKLSGLAGGMDLAICPDGNVAITDFMASCVRIYRQTGQYLNTMHSGITRDKWYPFGITVDDVGRFYVTNRACSVEVFDSQCLYKSQFLSSETGLLDNKDMAFGGIAIDNDGLVLIGDCTTNHISKHKQNGSFISNFKVNIKPRFLSVCPDGNIAISAWEHDKGVQIIDSDSGDVLHTLNAPPDVPYWCPSGVCCYQDIIFVSNCPRSLDYPDGIYCFSMTTGEYLRCITNEVFFPLGLMTDGKRLMVTELKCVKIFKATLNISI